MQGLGVTWFSVCLDDISAGIDAAGQAKVVNALLARLRALGCQVRTDRNGRPRVTGASELPEWLRDAIREDFPKLLPLLASTAA